MIIERLTLSLQGFALGMSAGWAIAGVIQAEPADKVLADARQVAAKQNKNLFVKFDASW